jgi:hypothetical protein
MALICSPRWSAIVAKANDPRIAIVSQIRMRTILGMSFGTLWCSDIVANLPRWTQSAREAHATLDGTKLRGLMITLGIRCNRLQLEV